MSAGKSTRIERNRANDPAHGINIDEEKGTNTIKKERARGAKKAEGRKRYEEEKPPMKES